MVAQVVRQNVKATYALPMNTLEWAGMILRTCGLALGMSGVHTQTILACMQRCTAKYDSYVEVDAYVMQPVAKRAAKAAQIVRRLSSQKQQWEGESLRTPRSPTRIACGSAPRG